MRYSSKIDRVRADDLHRIEARLLGGVARDVRRPARELVGVAAVEPLEVGALLNVRERNIYFCELGLGAIEDVL